MPKTNKLYTEPKIKASGKEWYVWFRFLDEKTGKMKLIIRKGGANYATLSPKERISELTLLKKAIEYKLEVQGWNPITNTYPEKSLEEIEIEKLKDLTFTQGLDFAYEKKSVDWARKTKLDYSSVIRAAKQAALSTGILNEKIADLKRPHYKILLERILIQRNVSSKGYNKYRRFLSSLLSELVEWEVLEYNPVDKIKTKDEIKTVCHRPLPRISALLS